MVKSSTEISPNTPSLQVSRIKGNRSWLSGRLIPRCTMIRIRRINLLKPLLSLLIFWGCAQAQDLNSEVFKDCSGCPEMVVIPSGPYGFGSPPNEFGGPYNEGYILDIYFEQPFAIARHEVTFTQWELCVKDNVCRPIDDEGYGRGERPVNNVSWKMLKYSSAGSVTKREKHIDYPQKLSGNIRRKVAQKENASLASTRKILVFSEMFTMKMRKENTHMAGILCLAEMDSQALAQSACSNQTFLALMTC